MANYASENGNALSDLSSIRKSLTLDFLVADPKSETKMFADLDDPEYFS